MGLAFLGACSDPPEKSMDPAMLVGAWLMLDGRHSYPLGCQSSAPIRYYSDGTFALFAVGGTWRLDDNRLIEVATAADRLHADAEGTIIGKPYVSELTLIDQDRFKKRFSDGEVVEFRRCPKYEKPPSR